MTASQNPELITYVDSAEAAWQDFRPGSRRKVLYENAATGQVTMLVQWDPGYRMGVVEHHEYDEHRSQPRVPTWHVHPESRRLGAPVFHARRLHVPRSGAWATVAPMHLLVDTLDAESDEGVENAWRVEINLPTISLRPGVRPPRRR
jgi:hypothetical protein